MRRERGAALIAVIVLIVVTGMLLTVAIQRFMIVQRTVRRCDTDEAALTACRGAIRWAQGATAKDPHFEGTMRRAHDLGEIVVTANPKSIRATLRGRAVTLALRGTPQWREE